MELTRMVEGVNALRRRMDEHAERLRRHEQATRVALIDPVLRLAGWPPEDPGKVAVEATFAGGRADYALQDGHGRAVGLLEAKVLGTRLEGHTRQVVTYATETGIGWAGLTDGDRWMVYDVLRPVPLQDKRALDIRLSSDPPLDVAVELMYWLSAPIRKHARGREDVQGPERGRRLPQQAEQAPSGQEADGQWRPIGGMHDPPSLEHGGEVKDADGGLWPVRHWQHAVGVVGEWLVSSGRLAEHRIPLQVRDITHGIHWEPIHADHAVFFRKHECKAPSGRPVFVHTFANRRLTAVHYIEDMLERCGVDGREVAIRVEQP